MGHKPEPRIPELYQKPVKTAKELFLEYTGRSGVVDRLYGPSNLSRRVEILTVLAGGATVTKAQAGWTKFRQEMLRLYNIVAGPGDCIASLDDRLIEAASGQTVPTAEERLGYYNYLETMRAAGLKANCSMEQWLDNYRAVQSRLQGAK